MALERWNTHFSTTVEVEILGHKLRLAQDPSSEHLGTTVWDASIVAAKYFEKNIRKGDFSRPKVRGKRAIDLGSGMGLAGLALALVGADVVLTDVAEVLPLLRRNSEANLSPAALRASGDGHAGGADAAGKVKVAELDWTKPGHCFGEGEGGRGVVSPPFDIILATDCVYHEHLVRDLCRTVLALSNERTLILVCNERRSESVQAAFVGAFSRSFSFKRVPVAKLAEGYSHPAIEMTILKRRRDASAADAGASETAEAAAGAEGGAAEAEGEQGSGGEGAAAAAAAEGTAGAAAAAAAAAPTPSSSSSSVAAAPSAPPPPTAMALAAQMAESLGLQAAPSSFDDRRAGAMAARLLAGVEVPPSASPSTARPSGEGGGSGG